MHMLKRRTDLAAGPEVVDVAHIQQER